MSIKSYSKVLDKKYGVKGSESRKAFDDEALNFYASQLILQNRKEVNMTQKELAEKTGIDKSYLSRIEKGLIQPTMPTMLKIVNAMGRQIEVV